MDKLSQQRTWRSKLWEKMNLSGRALEALSDEVRQVMERMRETDAKIREVAVPLKDATRYARSGVRQRDYLSAATNLVNFHERLKHISFMLSEFVKDTNIKNYEMLLSQMSDEQKEQLFGYDPKKSMDKEAGIKDLVKKVFDFSSDSFSNLFRQKNRAMALLEKRFSNQFVKDLKNQTIAMVSRSEDDLAKVLECFSALESGVSRRDVGLYDSEAKKMMRIFAGYDKAFQQYYNKIIVPLKAFNDEMSASKPESKPEEVKQEFSFEQAQDFAREQQEEALKKEKEKLQKKNQEEEAAKIKEKLEEKSLPQEKTFKEWQEEKKKSLDKLEELQEEKKASFLSLLSKYASQNLSGKMIQGILEFSQEIEEQDPEASEKLIQIAAEILIDNKLKKNSQAIGDKPEELEKKMPTVLPEGTVDKSFSSIPELNSLSIELSPEAASHLYSVFYGRMLDFFPEEEYAEGFDFTVEKLAALIKNSIKDGWVLTISKVEDSSNPRDRYITIYTGIELSELGNWIFGMAKMKVVCRYLAKKQSLSIKSIQKNFTIKKK